jgi:hypothetical protein
MAAVRAPASASAEIADEGEAQAQADEQCAHDEEAERDE